MAFFKFRKAADEPAKAPPPPQSIEAVRQRAKHRLVGATVLVVMGVIGLPLLFDKQPRPIAVDTPIDIPDRNKVAPLVLPAAASAGAVTQAAVAPLPTSGLAKTAAAAAIVASSTVVLPTREASQPANVSAKPVAEAASAAAKAVTVGDKNIPLAPVNKASDATKNAAKVVGGASSPVKVTQPTAANATASVKVTDAKPPVVKPTDAAPVQTGRYILQVGAFADTTRAHEVRLKLEHAGLKTYTHVADTPEGKRIRVRVGPFAAKAEAEKVAVKIKKLNLPAALLTL